MKKSSRPVSPMCLCTSSRMVSRETQPDSLCSRKHPTTIERADSMRDADHLVG
eukprot:CAMPEP_0177783384 /NCGR_PEP_ID=MMETSP0491_2-20121128/19071_1 /TAXON_ID=63592 /ORGANISM="Tetraselmis chuii, Strain PLY429" /LENGTH=52 /DNA_ID=CAMNT_0019303945 /DNA_START=164 /DNA_END=322 /DNA_ORIENTATION=+